jgi:hypothetical protein
MLSSPPLLVDPNKAPSLFWLEVDVYRLALPEALLSVVVEAELLPPRSKLLLEDAVVRSEAWELVEEEAAVD